MASINAVAISIKADTGLARNEINSLKSLLRSSVDPVRNLDAQMQLLNKAYEQGAIEEVNYREAHAKITAALKAEEKAARDAAAEYIRLKEASEPVFMAQEVVKKSDMVNQRLKETVTYVAALAVARQTINEFVDAFQRVDDLADTAAGLNTEYNKLKTFAASLAEIGGVSFDQAISGIKSLNEQIGQAALGVGKSGKLFDKLGLDPKSLASLDVTEQFGAIAKAIGELESSAARAAIAKKLFGDSNIAAAATNYYETIKKTNKEMEAFNIPLSDEEVARLSKAADLFERITMLLTSIKDKLAALALSDYGARALGTASNFFKPLEIYSQMMNGLKAPQTETRNIQQATRSLEALQQQEEENEKNEKLAKEFRKQQDALQQKINTLKYGKEYANAMELKSQGYSPEQIKTLQKMEKYAASLEEMEKERKKSGWNTRDAFDMNQRQQQQNVKVAEDQRDLQRRIAAASEETAKRIASLKPIKVAR